MLIRAYCENEHQRVELAPRQYDLCSICPDCKEIFTRESLYQSLPPFYKNIVDTDLGGVLASFADIGAIDLIFRGKYPLAIEYARERHLEND